MSGLLIGMIYKRRQHLGVKFYFKKMWRRALQLYIVGVGLTFIYLFWAIHSGHTGLKDMPPNFSWSHYGVQALLMRFTYGWADFLVRFAILMLVAPFVFFLISKGKWWLALIGILTAWALRGQNFTLSWQLLFNVGMIIGFYWNELETRYRALGSRTKLIAKRTVASAAGLTFAISYTSVFVLSVLFDLWGRNDLPHWWQHLAYVWGNWNYDTWLYADKWTMGPVRVALFFLWFPVLFWLIRRYERAINRLTRGFIELLGRNSLFVYTAHSLIIFIFKLYVIPSKTGFVQNFLITSFGLILLVAITYLYKKIEGLWADNFKGFKLVSAKGPGKA
jgi:hypothetical protein